MPRKIRQIIRDLEKAGFQFQPGKGSHRKYRHPRTTDVVVVAGQLSDDCQSYQERDLRAALENLARIQKVKTK